MARAVFARPAVRTALPTAAVAGAVAVAALRPAVTSGTVAAAFAAVATPLFQVAVICRLHVGDVQEAVAADAEIDERGLDAGFDVDDAALVDVADVTLVARALDVEFFEDAVFKDGDAALFGLQHIDEHFFFHAKPSAVECSVTACG